jgi:hypothetical protein
VPVRENRESGANPVRTRRCNRDKSPDRNENIGIATVALEKGCGKAGEEIDREPEDLPERRIIAEVTVLF